MKIFSEYRGLGRNNYIIFIGKTMTSFGSMVFSMITLILSQKLGVSASDIAMIMFAIGIAGMPASYIGGKLGDRYSKKRIIIICDICSILACFFAASVSLSYFSLTVFAIGSLLQSMEYPSYTALIAEVTPPEKRQQAFSLNYLGMNLGMVLSPALAGILFENHLSLMFALQGICIGFSTLLIAFVLNEKEVYQSENIYEQARDDMNFLDIVKGNGLVVLFLVVMAVYSGVYCEYQYLLPLDMGKIHGDQGALIYGSVTSINCLTVVLFTPLITKLFRKKSDLERIENGIFLVLAGYGLFVLCKGFIPAYYLVMTIFTWGEIFVTISMDSYITQRIPSSHTGRIISLSNILQGFATGSYQMGIGFLYDHDGSTFTWIVIILTGLISLVLINFIRLRDRKKYAGIYERRHAAD